MTGHETREAIENIINNPDRMDQIIAKQERQDNIMTSEQLISYTDVTSSNEFTEDSISLEEASQDNVAPTEMAKDIRPEYKPKQYKTRGFICPSDKQIAAIISFGTDYKFTNDVPWPEKKTFFMDEATELIKWIKAEIDLDNWEPISFKSSSLRYAAWINTARKIAARYPEAQVNCKYTTENSRNDH